MTVYTYKNMADFVTANAGVAFRIWVYKKMFTPYEQQGAFIDESRFEDNIASVGVLRECVSLGNGDYLLGFQIVEDVDSENHDDIGVLEYYRLQEIRMAYFKSDQEQEEE